MLVIDHIPITQQVFREKNAGRNVARASQLPEMAPERHAPLGLTTFHHLEELGVLPPALDCFAADPEPRGKLLVRALNGAKALQFVLVDLGRRPTDHVTAPPNSNL
jgi:hypothetical protein